jgi:ariadne-1
MLQNKDLVNRLYAQRQRHVIDCLNLKWCPQAYCGLLINLVPSSNSLPCSAACENAHMFCLSCSNEAHSPVCCADLLVWQEYLREQIKSVNLKDPDNISNILVSDRVNKSCPICFTKITKDEGCNKMRLIIIN